MNKNTINKQQETNTFNIKNIKFPIEGKILYMTSSENNNIFVITDLKYFYVIEKGMEKSIKQYKIPSSSKNVKCESDEIEAQIWCSKLGNHVIFKYTNNIYYYNPNIPKEKVQEIILYYKNEYLNPYAFGFNNDYFEISDTGEILFSDINSEIYKLRIKSEKNKLTSCYSHIFSFQKNDYSNEMNEEDEDDDDFFDDIDFFKMDKNEKILDIKIIISSENMDAYDQNLNTKGKNILIIAITKNKLFQFYGKDSFENVFKQYTIENGDILKSYKLFHNNKNYKLNKSRIQLFNQYLPFYQIETFTKPEIVFSCMFQCGYCIGKFKDLFNISPQKQFILFDYPKQHKKNIFPIMVCQSMIHIFFLYEDKLVIKNKLTNRIADIININEKCLDIYYNLVMNEIIFYSPNNIYQISLNSEHKYLWKYYIEIGEYKFALHTLTKEDKYMKPILHKLYANLLFEQKKYDEAVEHYAASDENFEHICLKLMSISSNEYLLKYLALIFHFELERKKGNKNNYERILRKQMTRDCFIEKYLINTWLFELLITKKEKEKKEEVIPFIKDYTRNNTHGYNFINKNILYYVFNNCSKYEELIEYAKINQDHEVVIMTLINNDKIREALEYIKVLFYFENEKIKNIKNNIFFKYATIFMQQYPKETIDVLDKQLNIHDNHKEIIRILLSFNANDNDNISHMENKKVIISFIIKKMYEYYKVESIQANFKDINTLYNLLILFLSLIDNNENQNLLTNYLEDIIYNESITSYDLNFTKKVFDKNPYALSIIYYKLNKYQKCVEISLENNINHILKYLFKKTENKIIKNNILHYIIDYKKRNNSFNEIINYNIDERFKLIDDFFLQITDNLKIYIFQDDQFYDSIINVLLD